MAGLQTSDQKEKENIRREIWAKLERYEVVTHPRPCYGKIPGFIGSRGIQAKLLKLESFRNAETIYTTPDIPLRLVREESLRKGKNVVVSIPGLRGYIILNPHLISPQKYGLASTLRGALSLGERIRMPEGLNIDLVFLGSVGTNIKGARLGRGDGIYDVEYAILRELHSIDEKTPVATIVHDLQVVEREIPMLKHDVPVDFILTPTRLLITATPYPRPPGIIWELLSIGFIKSNPILRMLFGIS